MPRRRYIDRKPAGKNYYLVDANFLANRVIPVASVANERERKRVQRSHDWWAEIDKQLASGHALVYVPDVCIAESFKVVAKKYYVDKYFRRPIDFKNARDRLGTFLRTTPKTLRGSKRHIKVHDLPTSRDIVIAVDRFYEFFLKKGLSAGVVDLFILATAKYLVDFFAVPQERLHIVTLDNALWRGSKAIQDVPSAFNPNHEFAANVFR